MSQMKARLHQTEPPNALPTSWRCVSSRSISAKADLSRRSIFAKADPVQPRVFAGGSFTRNTRFAFDHGGDHFSYVSQLITGNNRPVKLEMANIKVAAPSL
jgi:hypothetical protein